MKTPGLLFSALIGAVASARSMTPMASLAAARLLGRRTPGQLVLLDQPVFKWGALAMGVGELLGDKMKSAPDRTVFLLGLLPHIFSIPNIGSGWDIVTMMIPFLLATSFFALAVSRWFTDSEAPLLMIAFFSVGYIFLSGVSYPLELMPWYWQAAHYVFPVAPAVLAFVKLNSMGGSLADIWPQMLTLWIQVIIYGAWAVYTTRRVYKRSNIKTGDIEA